MASFDCSHEFPAPPAAVAGAMTDPEFVSSVRLPDLEPPEILARDETGAGTVLRYRYRFVGTLDPLGRRILGNDRISWVQEVTVAPDGRDGRLRVTPDARAERLEFSGAFRLDDGPNGGTVRSLTGTLAIKVPLIGGRAERHVLPGLLRRVDLEAEALREWLAARP
jgi:hypothetical protein